jgi:hypothetical protein
MSGQAEAVATDITATITEIGQAARAAARATVRLSKERSAAGTGRSPVRPQTT